MEGKDGQGPEAATTRIPAIDILRGVAIAWVVLFHLWGDMEFFPGAPSVYYESLTNQVRDGAGAWPIFTAFTDLIFRLGFQGVPLFMMISGISLTVAAYRTQGNIHWLRFVLHRFRKLLAPYWVGVALTYGVMALIAWRQVSLDDALSFQYQFAHGVTISKLSLVTVDGATVWASIALIPRLLEDDWFFAPQLALWFVGLIAQYYLLFPLLFLVMRKIGVVPFLLATFAITVASNIWIVERYGAPEFQFRLVTGWAPFRLFEFTAGMAIGWLLAAPGRERALGMLRSWLALVPIVAVGLIAHTAGGLLIGEWTARYWQALALPLATLGLAMLSLPMLVKRPGRVEASIPLRAVATIGVMSYAILIVNDAMRLVASQVRVEEPSHVVWWTFLVAVYVPASLLLAWPLAHLLGLMPKRAARTRALPRADILALEARLTAIAL